MSAAMSLNVMSHSDEALEDVPVHADVMALVEAFRAINHQSMPWSILLSAAAAVPSDHELLTVGGALAGRVSDAVSDAVTDLLDQRLLSTSAQGLTVTARGAALIRRCNGAYMRRLEAARRIVDELPLGAVAAEQ